MCSKCWSLHQTTAAVSQPQMCANVQNVPNNQQLCKCRKRYFARKCAEDAVSFSVVSKPQNPQNLWPHTLPEDKPRNYLQCMQQASCVFCAYYGGEVKLVQQQLLWSLALKFRETCLHNLSPYPADLLIWASRCTILLLKKGQEHILKNFLCLKNMFCETPWLTFPWTVSEFKCSWSAVCYQIEIEYDTTWVSDLSVGYQMNISPDKTWVSDLLREWRHITIHSVIFILWIKHLNIEKRGCPENQIPQTKSLPQARKM